MLKGLRKRQTFSYITLTIFIFLKYRAGGIEFFSKKFSSPGRLKALLICLFLFAALFFFQQLGGKGGGPEPVVDIEDRQSRGAAIEHGEEGG